MQNTEFMPYMFLLNAYKYIIKSAWCSGILSDFIRNSRGFDSNLEKLYIKSFHYVKKGKTHRWYGLLNIISQFIGSKKSHKCIYKKNYLHVKIQSQQ